MFFGGELSDEEKDLIQALKRRQQFANDSDLASSESNNLVAQFDEFFRSAQESDEEQEHLLEEECD